MVHFHRRALHARPNRSAEYRGRGSRQCLHGELAEVSCVTAVRQWTSNRLKLERLRQRSKLEDTAIQQFRKLTCYVVLKGSD